MESLAIILILIILISIFGAYYVIFDNSMTDSDKFKYLIYISIVLLFGLGICIYKIGEINGHNAVVTMNKNLADLHLVKIDLDRCGWTLNCINYVKNKYADNPFIQDMFRRCMKCSKS